MAGDAKCTNYTQLCFLCTEIKWKIKILYFNTLFVFALSSNKLWTNINKLILNGKDQRQLEIKKKLSKSPFCNDQWVCCRHHWASWRWQDHHPCQDDTWAPSSWMISQSLSVQEQSSIAWWLQEWNRALQTWSLRAPCNPETVNYL